ncbi:MAG: hypothetical protein GX463_04075 [Methanothrix sp.]|nr:hypothetical protein [Methanothrix sp.]HNU39168.1 hypothetical protein [Methanothrix sp.]
MEETISFSCSTLPRFTSGARSIISTAHTEFLLLGRNRYVVMILRRLGWIFLVCFSAHRPGQFKYNL